MHAFISKGGSTAFTSCRSFAGRTIARRSSSGRRTADRWRRLEFGQYTLLDQLLVGSGIQLIEIGQYVFFEELEHDQLDANFHTQPRTERHELFAQRAWPEGVALVFQFLADQRIQPRGQVRQGCAITTDDARDHGIQRHRLFQHIILDQRKALERHRTQLRRLANLVLIEGGKAFKDLLQKATLDRFTLQT